MHCPLRAVSRSETERWIEPFPLFTNLPRTPRPASAFCNTTLTLHATLLPTTPARPEVTVAASRVSAERAASVVKWADVQPVGWASAGQRPAQPTVLYPPSEGIVLCMRRKGAKIAVRVCPVPVHTTTPCGKYQQLYMEFFRPPNG